MLLNEYLNSTENKRRILIVSDLSKGQALLRRYEERTGEMVRNVSCATLNQLVKEMHLYIQSDQGYMKQNELLDDMQAMMLFRNVIFSNAEKMQYFKNDKMMDLVTTKEIYQKANLIRSNGWNGEERKTSNSRISDLKLLISEYERTLKDKNQIDLIAVYQTVIDAMKQWNNLEQELDNIFAAEISYLTEEVDCFSGIQNELLKMILNQEKNAVDIFSGEMSTHTLSNCKNIAEFYRGYGVFNEVSYVVNDILKNNIPFGAVTLIYNSSTQLPAISSALKGNSIPMKIVTSHPNMNNIYINLAKRIIEWAKNDYSEEYLEAILVNPIICVEIDNKESGEKENALAKQSYFNYILEARNRRENSFTLGWGYERNVKFVQHEREYNNEVNSTILDMHEALIGIFGDTGKTYEDTNKSDSKKNSLVKIYDSLIGFIETYTKRTRDYAIGMSALRDLQNTIRLEEKESSVPDILNFIDELLSGITTIESMESDEVAVRSLNDWILLERPNVYVIGLSLKDMQGNIIESPILSDEEMSKYIGEGYKPTVKNESNLKEKNLLRTLMTFNGKRIVFGYSSYDTVGFCESNPCNFFRDALMRFKSKNLNEIDEFVYGNPSDIMQIETSKEVTYIDTCGIKLQTSNSAMEVLLDCPKKYAYDKKMHIPDNKYTQNDNASWLDSRLRGSFFHEIAEKYVQAMLVKPGYEEYEENVDDKLIRRIAEEIKERMLIEIPVAYCEIANDEVNQLFEIAKAYLQKLHNDYNESTWRALLVEQKFSDAHYIVNSYTDSGKEYDFVFSGTIDRIDYRKSESDKVIYLRIVDYKTGKKASKEKENNLGKLLQYSVYKKALMGTGKIVDQNGKECTLQEYVRTLIAKLELIPDMDDWTIEFDCFQYAFPMENPENIIIEIKGDQTEGINLTRLKVILTVIENNKIYPDHMELARFIKEYSQTKCFDDSSIKTLDSIINKPDVKNPLQDEASHCIYCSYADLCEHRKAGAI